METITVIRILPGVQVDELLAAMLGNYKVSREEAETDLKDLKGFGQKALDEVKEKLTELNI